MNKKFTTFGFAAFALLAVVSQGAIVTEMNSNSFGLMPPGSTAFTLPLFKFDPVGKGPLQSVSLVLDLETFGNLTFDNETVSPGAVTLTITFGASATTAGPSVLSVNTQVSKTQNGMVAADNDGVADFLGADSFSISGAGNANNFTTQTGAGFLSQYTATLPNEQFLVTINNSNFFNAAGVFGPSLPTGAAFKGRVTVGYTYLLVPVPEVGTALWGAGLAVFSAFRRSRVRRGQA